MLTSLVPTYPLLACSNARQSHGAPPLSTTILNKIYFSGRLFFFFWGGCTKALCENVLRFHMHDSTVLVSGPISHCQPCLSLTYLLAPWSSGQLRFIPFPHPGLSALSEWFASSRPASVKIKVKVYYRSFTQYAPCLYRSGWPKRANVMTCYTQMK